MSYVTVERSVRFTLRTALLEVGRRLRTAVERVWEDAVRQAERPTRFVPYC